MLCDGISKWLMENRKWFWKIGNSLKEIENG
jgi:hypothetical protein